MLTANSTPNFVETVVTKRSSWSSELYFTIVCTLNRLIISYIDSRALPLLGVVVVEEEQAAFPVSSGHHVCILHRYLIFVMIC